VLYSEGCSGLLSFRSRTAPDLTARTSGWSASSRMPPALVWRVQPPAYSSTLSSASSSRVGTAHARDPWRARF
jgi:hypothetical protein